MKPIIRVQRRRTKGFDLQAESPDGRPVVYVGRPNQWGNHIGWMEIMRDNFSEAHAKMLAKKAFETYCKRALKLNPDFLAPLRDKHLACWCKIGEPCHADVLVEYINAKYTV